MRLSFKLRLFLYLMLSITIMIMMLMWIPVPDNQDKSIAQLAFMCLADAFLSAMIIIAIEWIIERPFKKQAVLDIHWCVSMHDAMNRAMKELAMSNGLNANCMYDVEQGRDDEGHFVILRDVSKGINSDKYYWKGKRNYWIGHKYGDES